MNFLQWWRAWREKWKAPRQLKVTRSGKVYLVVTLGVGMAALNTGNNLLYLLLGFLLSIIVASGVLSEACLQYLRLKRLLPSAVWAGEPFTVRYEVRKLKGWSFALEIVEEDRPVKETAWLTLVDNTTPAVVRAIYLAGTRGPLALRKLKVTTTFPLGLFAKSRTLEFDDTLLIYPRRIPSPSPDKAQGLREVGEGQKTQRRDGTGEFWGLKELTEGEDGRRIHWKKSAAAGKLLRVERERDERRQYLLSIDEEHSPQALDRDCEEAAALAHRLLAQGYEVGLKSKSQSLRPGYGEHQERRILSALAWAGHRAP